MLAATFSIVWLMFRLGLEFSVFVVVLNCTSCLLLANPGSILSTLSKTVFPFVAINGFIYDESVPD